MLGKFIVIEGTDGSGKGTQFKLLVSKLKELDYEVETADFPQYGKPSAGLVQEYLNGKYGTADEVGPHVASIFYACDRYDASFKLQTHLKAGKIIVANRYETSNRAFQGQKISDPMQRKKFYEWITDLEYNIFKIPRPDLVIFLHVPPEIGQQLVSKKEKRSYTDKTHDIHEADIDLLKRTEKVYLELSKEPNWVKVDCIKEDRLMSIKEIHKKILDVVKKYLEE